MNNQSANDQGNTGLAPVLRAKLKDANQPFGIMTHLHVINVATGDKLEAILRKVIRESRKEPGNLTYQVSRDIEDPTLFILYDRWASIEAVSHHEASAYFKEGSVQMEGLVAGQPEVNILQPVGEELSGTEK